MAWTNWGFDGTINEAQWAQMAGLLGNDYVAAGNGDCVVTAVAGARSVSVAAGTLYGDGVVSVNSAPETVAMTTPVNGQWYVIALKRDWATNVASLRAVAGATTSTTTPTAPPTSFPTLNTQPGTVTDQPIAWAWCNSANTTVVVYDIRKRAVKSMPPVVANAAERDAKFMSPTQGLQVWQDDLGVVLTYYGLFNQSTNPGGRDAAGWYSTSKRESLIPIRPGIVTAVGSGASAVVTALGTVNFTNCTNIVIDNAFTSTFKKYKVFITVTASLGNTECRALFRKAGANITSGYYGVAWYASYANTSGYQGARNNGSDFYIGQTGGFGGVSEFIIEPSAPIPQVSGEAYSPVNATKYTYGYSAANTNPDTYDGFHLYPSGGGTISGTITITGINI